MSKGLYTFVCACCSRSCSHDNSDLPRLCVYCAFYTNRLQAENGRLRKAIKAAIRIKDLWTLEEVETQFEDEAKALQAMLTGFEQALKGE